MDQYIKEATADIRRNKWIGIIAARNASGLSIKAWCQENGVNETSYYYWLKKMRSHLLDSVNSSHQSSSLSFVPLLKPNISTATEYNSPCIEAEMTIASGDITINLGKGSSAELVLSILKVLKNA